jgi:hypothetical protein
MAETGLDYYLFAEEDFLYTSLKPVKISESDMIILKNGSNIPSASNVYKLLLMYVTLYYESYFSVPRSTDKSVPDYLRTGKKVYEQNLVKFGMSWSKYALKKVSLIIYQVLVSWMI